MKKEAKRLKALIPEGGGYDLTFNIGNGTSKDTLMATLIVTLFKKVEDGKQPQISKRVTIVGLGSNALEAQTQALRSALDLL